MDRIDSLRVFIRIAELGSFRSTAEDMGIPKASVSAALAQLEKELGVRLLHRTTRRVGLTTDGVALLDRARGLVDSYEQLMSDTRDAADSMSGRVVVDAPSRIAHRIVIPGLVPLFELHPLLEIDLGANDLVLDLVLERVDCVVRVGELVDSSLVALPVGTLQMTRCASPGYLDARPDVRRPQDLLSHAASHCAVGYSPARRDTGVSRIEILKLGNARRKVIEVALQSKLTVHTAEAYVEAALAGIGLIEVPRFDVQELIEQGLLVEVLPTMPPPSLPLNVLLPHRRQLPTRVRGVATWLRELLQPLCEAKSRDSR